MAEPPDPANPDPVRLYSTRSEQREAGLKHPLTPWLTAGGLAQLEWDYARTGYSGDHPNRSDAGKTASVQLSATATPWSFAKGELILDYDTDTDRIEVDEAVASLEHNAWELAYGRQYLPFGVYFSHFASGPLLEFGETRDVAASLAYDFEDRVDLSASVFRGQGRKTGAGGPGMGWTLAMETWLNESLSLGVSSLSDLADADSDLPGDTGYRSDRRVPGPSGYLLWTADNFEVTAEIVGATRSFRGLESDRNQPTAWNLEFANFLTRISTGRCAWKGAMSSKINRNCAMASPRVSGLGAMAASPSTIFTAATNTISPRVTTIISSATITSSPRNSPWPSESIPRFLVPDPDLSVQRPRAHRVNLAITSCRSSYHLVMIRTGRDSEK